MFGANQANPVAASSGPDRLLGRARPAESGARRSDSQPVTRSGSQLPGVRPAVKGPFRRDPTKAASGHRAVRNKLRREERQATHRRAPAWQGNSSRRRSRRGPYARRVPARDQHHLRLVNRRRQPLGDRETIEIRKLDVEQHNVRPQALDGSECRNSTGYSSDDVEALGVEQRARRRTKSRRGRRRSGRSCARLQSSQRQPAGALWLTAYAIRSIRSWHGHRTVARHRRRRGSCRCRCARVGKTEAFAVSLALSADQRSTARQRRSGFARSR